MAKRKKQSNKKGEEPVKQYVITCEDCGKTKITFQKLAYQHLYCSECIEKYGRKNQKGVLYFR